MSSAAILSDACLARAWSEMQIASKPSLNRSLRLQRVIRTIQPVMSELGHEVEEASATLGATRIQTIARVIQRASWMPR